MPQRTYYPDGTPCWPELTTRDLPGVIGFYEKIFGWTCQGLGPRFWHYTMCLVDGEPVAAITPPAIGLEPGEAVWHIYIATSDVEVCAKRVEVNDGKLVILPVTLPDFGSFALATDPDGATFGLWQAGPHLGARLLRQPGTMCWNELHTRNVKMADGFYEALFGYEREQIGDGIDYDYIVWKIGGEPVCGRLRMQCETARGEPHWKTYFTVANCDEVEARVLTEGGKVLIGAYETPHGRVAIVADPGGAVFGICQHNGEPFTR
jgi:predicted enzyme related to lactoylglutathione lyase